MSRYARIIERYQPTSLAAWRSIADHLGEIDGKILRYVIDRDGATCADVETALGLSHQTASAQIAHLSRAAILSDSGRTRKNGSGRACIVWIVAEPVDRLPFGEAA